MDKIDFVITWVDGNDPAWQADKNNYAKQVEKTDIGRYRDWGFLPYWFRGVEFYAPWVNHIYFVTCGHVPVWLKLDHPKLTVVNHRDFIPEKWLPTFSSNSIELNFARIPNLSEHFVYFNDDTLLNAPVAPEFFFRKGVPCDFIRFRSLFFTNMWDSFDHMLGNNQAVINQHFRKKELSGNKIFSLHYSLDDLRKNLQHMIRRHTPISIMDNPHLPMAYLKSSFEELWKLEPEICAETSSHKFRSPLDITSWLVRDIQLCKGNFYPVARKARGQCYEIGTDNVQKLVEAIGSNKKMLCFNDGYMSWEEFEVIKNILLAAFEKKYVRKSSFEKN